MHRAPEPDESPRPSVWIVDDSAYEGQMAARTLSDRFEVELFLDGHSMLDRLAARRAPDALVLDWLLPDISGVDVCRFLRANQATASLPVLVLSIRGEKADVLEGLTAGADDYLVKPFHSAELVARVTALVRTREHLERAERAERAFRSLLEHLPDVVVAVDRAGRVTFVNDEGARVLDPEGRGLRGAAVGELLPGVPCEVADGARSSALGDHRIGERVFAPFVRSIPMSDLATTVIVLRDVTRDRLAADAAQRADQRKDEFLAMLGHELRNPLSAIATALHLTSLQPDNPRVNDRARDVLVRQTAHMSRMIDDLLDVSRITRGKIQLRCAPLDFRATFERALETVRPALAARRQQVHVASGEAPLRVVGDPTRLEQVMVNLLLNAAKYTPEGGEVFVSATREGDEVVARVRDNGIGIPSEELPQIFDLFAQVESSLARAQGGLGIGLTLVRTLVTMHGGSVSAHSEGAGRGSEFVVRLPLASEGDAPLPEEAAAELSPPPSGHRPMRVLVVDDNPDIVELTVVALTSAGYEVTSAEDGPSALEAAGRARPEAVVLDLGLPGLDGFEVARRLRDDPAHEGMLIVALSGYGQTSDRERSQAAGVDYHFVKPVDFQVLYAALDRHGAEAARNVEGP